MVNVPIKLYSLVVDLTAGNADVLEKVVSAISSDAVVEVTNMPTEPTNSENLLSLFKKIQFRNLNQTSGAVLDDVRFRIAAADYTKFSNYMSDVFTPTWANSDAGDVDVDGNNDAKIRAKLDNAGATITNNTMTMTVDEGSVAAPGNFDGSEHGCFPDLHIGYVAAALTNAHEGRAVILNEESVFENLNGSFGTAFMSSLFNSASNVTVDGTDYHQLDLKGGSAGPLKELLSALYHGDPERFQSPTPASSGGEDLPDTEEFETLPIKSGDTISIKVTVSGGLNMNTSSLTTPASDGTDILPLIIPTASKANPSTYLAPFNVTSGVSSVAASDTAVANGAQELSYVAGVVHNGSNAVSLNIRPQKYEVKMYLI